MKRILSSLAVVLSIMGLSTSVLQAQMSGLHGDDRESRLGGHTGNQFRISVFNDGTFGGHVTGYEGEYAGEWPKNSGHYYLIDGNPMVLSEVLDTTGRLIHLISENKSLNISQTRGPRDPVTGEWWTFLPLPGFAANNLTTSKRVAMAKGGAEWPDSWPPFWPDIRDPNNPYGIYSPDGWAGAWNGYFGRDVFNADEESYFVADDYNQKEFAFYPDSNDHKRRGAGLRMFVRGLQWAKTAVKDGIFFLYDLQNIGTYNHDKMVFGFKVGNNMGETTQGGDAGDDRARYDRDLDIAYMYDDGCLPGEGTGTCTGAAGWGPDPVGFLGGAFLESPGNPYDGVDNDNDGRNGPGPTITEAMFEAKTLNLNDPIVLINYSDPTFPRAVTTLHDALAKVGKSDQDTLDLYFGKNPLPFKFWAGKIMQEIGDNLFDDNLNGLVDENRGQMDQDSVFHYLYIGADGVGYKYKDYLTGNGVNNLMIDERRDDGIDNDGDWNPLFDDKGQDGLGPADPGYPGPDLGEGDGMPTPGEPHFDKTDIKETDMIGLTSFYTYDWNTVFQYDPEMMWSGLAPGNFWYSYPGAANVELLFGTGYFPLPAGKVERFSLAFLCGTDLDNLVRNKGYFQEAYQQNYNFAKAPNTPTVKAVAGDKKVILFWDNFAEESVDPISGEDFEGYKIYRSTDPGWNDCAPITNGYGDVIFRQPLAQFDVDDDYSGFATTPTQGVQFYLGNNTGLKHYFVDTTAVNGTTYYYAVTSYDRGDIVRGIDPSEGFPPFVSVEASGKIEKGSNVVIVRPESPSAGYVPPKVGDGGITPGPENTASGSVSLKTYDPGEVKDNHTYQITFVDKDTTAATGVTKVTGGYTLIDKTSGDTLVNSHSIYGGFEGLPIVDGFQLAFSGNPLMLDIDTLTSGWSRPGIPAYDFRPYQRISGRPVSVTPSGDYEIMFAEKGIDTSKPYLRGTTLLPGIPVNFTVINTITNKKVPFGFRELDTTRGGAGVFSFNLTRRQSDEIIFLQLDDTVAGWWVRVTISSPTQADSTIPQPGDVLTLNLTHPFLSNDTYEFIMSGAQVNTELAKTDMDRIRVVPNPYIITNSWEPQNPYTTGRGERQLHFTHLPRRCTIRIFNVRGQLVNTLEHDSPLEDGTEIWNMLSKDDLEISYGIYIYHVSAEGVGERTGKFVVMK